MADPFPRPDSAKDPLIASFQRKIFEKLLDATRNNPLLYYKDSRTTRFGVPDAESEFVAALAAGHLVRGAEFGVTDDAGAVALRKRLTAIKAKAREFEEERGLRTLFLAVGMATWKSHDGGRDPLAPLFLIPAEIADDPRARGEFIVRRAEGADAVVNRALRLRAMAPPAFADALASEFEDGTVDDLTSAFARVRELAAQAPGITVLSRSAFGIFNFGAMAMIEDIDGASDVLAANPLVRALAGDEEAQTQLLGLRDGAVALTELDDIAPVDEPFVLDADPWQAQVIHTLIRREVATAIVDGPPGTGKSQTIANLIAAIVASGKSVLFVAEKRAALEVVQHRLSAAGLGHLILDLHAADTKRTRVYAALKTTRAKVGESPPPSADYDAPFVTSRKRLNEHVRTMHAPRPVCERSTYELLTVSAKLAAISVHARAAYPAARALGATQLADLRERLVDASRDPGLLFKDPALPWSSSRLAPNEVSAAVDTVVRVAGHSLRPLLALLDAIGAPCASLDDAGAAATELVALRRALAAVDPALLEIDKSTLALARATLMSPVGVILAWFSSSRRAALAKLAPLRRGGAANAAVADAIDRWQRTADAFRARADAIDAMPPELTAACASFAGDLAACERILGESLPTDAVAALVRLDAHAAAVQSAYRAAHLREVQADLERAGLAPLLDELRDTRVGPALWGPSLEKLWIDAHLDALRSELAAFNGRVHDGVVERFTSLDGNLRRVAVARVRRAAADRFVRATTAARAEESVLAIQLSKVRPRKPLRELVREAPNVLTALVPCIMASPLSISQFLPAEALFDFVLFDEASQVTPGNAVSAILRGRRVVLAGDERQLPPTDFFGSGGKDDDEDEEEESAVDGVESVLAAMRPFAKALGLRVHYRSRDERLIAFSNHWLYGNELVTFPGCGLDGRGVTHELAPPGGEIDEASSGPEVLRVVDLIMEHAAQRSHESLGVITLGLPHKLRIETALAMARRDRPELDDFFSDANPEPFFVKNLERVQGDERDAIVLTFGYGRTKTGAVSHNFGPINQRGGERRLNVAVTRAKSRLTVVSSFRSVDLDRSRLNSDGAKLLAKYLAYAESRGADLGRDGSVPDVPLNAFEAEIKAVLEQRIGLCCVPQYGVGQFRIDLAVQHPEEPGRFVMAIECDGASYHSTPTARMRDRLRQHILEGLGWRFCRIWSTDWFNDREQEVERVRAAYRDAIARAEATQFKAAASDTVSSQAGPSAATSSGTLFPSSTTAAPGASGFGRRSKPNPIRYPGQPIDSYSDRDLHEALVWIESDGRLRSDGELLDEMMRLFRYGRRGKRIAARFEAAIRAYRDANSR